MGLDVLAMTEQTKNFLARFFDYPLPVIFAGFYMYWMSRVIDWSMTLPNPSDAEWLVAAVVAGGAAYFKFYVDLVMSNQ